MVLSQDRFVPSKVRLREGQPTRLIFTTVNRKPAALVIESLHVQQWLAREPAEADSTSDTEVTRELSSNRVTEVMLDPRRGRYIFHDAISGATGEISVE